MARLNRINKGGHSLDYGSFPSSSPSAKILFRRIFLFMLAIATLAVGGVVGLQKLKMYNRNSVNNYLSGCSSVKAVEIYGFDDDLEWTVTTVIIHLKGGSARKIELCCPTSHELRTGSHLRVYSVGPYSMWTIMPDSSEPLFVDIGTDGEFPGLFQGGIYSVQDLIDHYDDILRTIESGPKYGSRKDSLGRVDQYRIR